MTQALMTPTSLGRLVVPNRVVMAPLTRMRATVDHVPTQLQADYYAQRASAGLIVSEATAISPGAVGWSRTPGLWSDEQVAGWRRVTTAVHAAGGRIVAQLWHTGSLSHPDYFGGARPLSASEVDPRLHSVTDSGHQPTVVPQAMTLAQIQQTVEEYAAAGRRASEAGFDGVQVMANFVYLIAQFLNSETNRRDDRYGGTTANRARLLFEVLEAVLEVVPADRVGVKFGPMHEGGAFAANRDTLATADHVFRRLDVYGLSHLLVMGPTRDLTGSTLAELAGDGIFAFARERFSGPLIGNVAMTGERADALIRAGTLDLAAFGQAFIANPDLPARLATGASLAEPDAAGIYGAGPTGYTDYPPLPPTASAA